MRVLTIEETNQMIVDAVAKVCLENGMQRMERSKALGWVDMGITDLDLCREIVRQYLIRRRG